MRPCDLNHLLNVGDVPQARNSHQPTAAGVHLPESTALRSDKGLDVLYSTPVRFVSRVPCISGHLHALASRSGEKCGLAEGNEVPS